jgi:DNA-binding transcriptional MocR family regulator
VLVTAGGQHGLLLALLALCERGDAVLTERLTHPGLRTLADRLGLRLVGVRTDAEGVVVDDLRDRAAEAGATVACFTPVLHNPTSVTWTETRFTEVAELAQEIGLRVIEDDVYRNLLAEAPASLHARRTSAVLVSSISKALTGGLRVGAVSAPEPILAEMRNGVTATMVMVHPLSVELASRLVTSPELETLLSRHRAAIAERHRIVEAELPGELILSPAGGLHAWIRVPPPWTTVTLLDEARRKGVLLSPAEVFQVEPEDSHAAVRLSLGGHLSTETFASAVREIAGMISGPSHPPSPIV